MISTRQFFLQTKEAHLKDLVEQSRFFELPAVLRAERPGADRFQYKLRLKGDSQEHTVEVAPRSSTATELDNAGEAQDLAR